MYKISNGKAGQRGVGDDIDLKDEQVDINISYIETSKQANDEETETREHGNATSFEHNQTITEVIKEQLDNSPKDADQMTNDAANMTMQGTQGANLADEPKFETPYHS